jgi:hypothetical protein
MFVWLLNKAFYKLVGCNNRKVCVATGLIGTPVHELGHAIFCILFFHKITGISLYKINKGDGVLGYVNHSYKKKNIYHQIGNFFIGVGPIILGSAVLALLMYLLVPKMFHGIILGGDSITFKYVIKSFWNVTLNFFTSADIRNVRWWVFIVLSGSIAIHMTLSDLDVKNSFLGFGFLAVVLFIVDVVFYLIGKDVLQGLTRWTLSFAFLTANFYIISILVCVLLVAVLGAIKGICIGVRTLKRKYA